MRFIKSRNELTKINEILDSDDLKVDFGDTFIGGTLHRLLGMGRSQLNKNAINTLAKKLDKLLASIFVKGSLSEDSEKMINDENTVELIRKQESVRLAKEASQKMLDGDIVEAKQLMLGVPEEDINIPGISTLNMKLIGAPKDSDENEPLVGEADVEDDNTEDIDYEDVDDSDDSDDTPRIEMNGKPYVVVGYDQGNDSFRLKDENGNEADIEKGKIKPDNEESKKILSIAMSNSEGGNNAKEKDTAELKNLLVDIEQKRENLRKVYQDTLKGSGGRKESQVLKLIMDIKTLAENFRKNTEKGEYDEISYVKLNKMISRALEFCKEGEKVVNDSFRYLSRFLEKKNDENLTQAEFNKIRAELDEESKKFNITEEQLRGLNKEIEETKGFANISGTDLKNVMDILSEAKDKLFHVKPYDEIRKNQRRYYDKLSDGRAINKLGYTTWTKEVNKMLAYYKDKFSGEGNDPSKRLMGLLSESLEKKNLLDDYVKLNQEFLGIKISPNKTSSNGDSALKKEDSEYDTIKIESLDKLSLPNDNKNNALFLKVKNKDNKTFNISSIIVSNSNKNSINIKYVKGYNKNIIESYFGVETDKIKTSTEFKDEVNDVMFAKIFADKGQIAIKDKLKVKAINFSSIVGDIKGDDIDTSNLDIIEDEWTIIGIFTLTEKGDRMKHTLKASKTPLKDGTFSEKLYFKISEILL